MARLYGLALSLGIVVLNVPASLQQSPSSLFLVSVPEQIHAGVPTSLAVTSLADFGVRVTAEVVQGDVRAVKSEDFTKDVTGLLTLPPILDTSLRSPLVLNVRCYKGDDVVFTNTTTVAFSPRNVTTFLQTDRARYQPGDLVRVWVASVYLDNLPYSGKVALSLNNPSGNTADRSQSSGNNGIVLKDFTLSQAAPLGQWTVATTINGLSDHVTFLVEHFENPVFDVLINTPPHVLTHDDISGSVRAIDSSGQPVHGSLRVTLAHDDPPFTLTHAKEIYGSAQFYFSGDDLRPLNEKVQSGKDVVVQVTAAVTGNSTISKGVEETKRVTVQISKEMYHLSLQEYPQALKPGMQFFAKLVITRFDRRPLSSADVREPVSVDVTQRSPAGAGEPTSLTRLVPEDGAVHLGFRLLDEVEALYLQARFQSSVVSLNLSRIHQSPSGSYIQISPIASTQIGIPLQITLEASVQPKSLHYVVKCKGQVVAAGTKKSAPFSLTPTAAWVPRVCVTVYCVLADGEIVSDTADILVEQQPIFLSWSSEKAQPGQQLTLSVTGPESGSEVGVVIMGTDDSARDVSVHFGEEECNVRVLTNGKLYETQQSEGSVQGVMERYWYHFMDGAEPLLWLEATMSGNTWTSEKITVPDGVNNLRAAAFVMSQRHGVGVASQKISVRKDFSLSLNVPPSLIRGEEIVLEVNIINHLHTDLEVVLLLAECDAFEFVMAQRGGVSVVNAQQLTLGSHVSAQAMFPVRVTALGEVDISVDAVSADASESMVWTVLVRPEGVQQAVSENLFLELPPTVNNFSVSAAFAFPEGVISDTRRAHLAIGGDILALSIHQLDSLIDLPLGCGEQNLIHFAPSVYVLQYLILSGQDDAAIRSKARRILEEGYQRQLLFQRSDGSFGAFGAKDSSGSTWLTAFVVKCFQQAQVYITVDQNVLNKARNWLLSNQAAGGEFTEAGRVMHSEMQAGLDSGPVALTAFVLITLLEDETTAGRYSDQVLLAQKYLESKIFTEVVSNYSLSLSAYALSLANNPKVSTALAELSRRADIQDGAKTWRSSSGAHSLHQPHSVQIEIAAYVLLAYFNSGDIVEAITLMKWLCNQRTHLGGFVSTQDTVVALQALADFAVFTGASAIDLRLKITAPPTPLSSIYQINSTNYRMYQSQEISVDNDLRLDIYMEGRGFAIFQMNVLYNVDSKTFSRNLQHTMNNEDFWLNVEVYRPGDDYNRLQLHVCTSLKENLTISSTGMAILDVGLLSGFTFSPGASASTDLIPKTETLADKVVLYFHTLNTTEVCVSLPLIRIYKVAQIQDAVVRVYDYYEPTRRATRTYNLEDLRTLDSCVFCGEDCELCKPAVSVIVSGFTSRSVMSASYSVICLITTVIFTTVIFTG